MTHIHKGNI